MASLKSPTALLDLFAYGAVAPTCRIRWHTCARDEPFMSFSKIEILGPVLWL